MLNQEMTEFAMDSYFEKIYSKKKNEIDDHLRFIKNSYIFHNVVEVAHPFDEDNKLNLEKISEYILKLVEYETENLLMSGEYITFRGDESADFKGYMVAHILENMNFYYERHKYIIMQGLRNIVADALKEECERIEEEYNDKR